MKEAPMVEISQEDLDELLQDQLLLLCLKGAGVDNWVGWDDACEMAEEMDS
jgi:hypothetical protein